MTQNRRFQYGSLFKRGTRTKMWVARWWEDVIGPEENRSAFGALRFSGPSLNFRPAAKRSSCFLIGSGE